MATEAESKLEQDDTPTMTHAGPLLTGPIQLTAILKRGVEERPKDPVLISMESVWSWSELEEKTTQLAAQYLALGLEPGDRVASLMPNRTALLAHYSRPCGARQ